MVQPTANGRIVGQTLSLLPAVRHKSRQGPRAANRRSGKWQGSVRRSPSSVDELGAAEHFGRRDRRAPQCRLRAPGGRRRRPRPPRARASRCNRPACRPALVSAAARVDAAGAAARRAWRCRPRCLSQGTSGWRRIVPVEEHGASSSTASNGSALPFGDVGADELGGERQPREIVAQAASSRAGERSTAVTCAPAAASCAVLPPGRGAQIGDAAAARRRRTAAPAAPPRRPAPTMRLRQNPAAPSPAPCAMHAHRAGRQHPAAEPRRPTFGVALHRQIERRLVAIGGGDGARGGLAVGLDPARHQPCRRVEHGRVERPRAARRLRAPCAAARR